MAARAIAEPGGAATVTAGPAAATPTISTRLTARGAFLVNAAFVVGFVTIWGLLRFLETRSTMVFVVYRIAFGLFLFLMLAVK